jgi:thymidine phosphorylase
LSKKIAAGSNHIIIDIPIGPTAKVKDIDTANKFKDDFMAISRALGVTLRIFFSDGNQPVGRGIGPALEAKDVLSVLRCDSNAPEELRERALTLAGYILEFSSNVIQGTGKLLATKILNDGRALKKFEAICQAQGGMPNGIAQFTIPKAPYTYTIVANKSGVVTDINNSYIANVAKITGAPKAKTAGVELLTPLDTLVVDKQPLYIIHAETEEELQNAIHYAQSHDIVTIGFNSP